MQLRGITNRDVRDLVARMLRDGWDATQRRKGCKLTWKNGFTLYIHNTVSDVRAVHNIRADIRRFTGLCYD